MSTSKSNDAIVSEVTKRISAIAKYLKAGKDSIPVQGSMLGADELIKLYQRGLDTRAAVAVARAAYGGAVKDREAANGGRLAADESLKAWVFARFGATSSEAGEFGFAPRKKTPVAAATLALAVEKRKATREARGTRGKKAKLKIKGVVTPPPSPAPSGSSSASSSSGGSTTNPNGAAAPGGGATHG